MTVFLIFLLLFSLSNAAPPLSTQQATATKGKFFVHTLHSAQFFPQSVPVKWEATLKGKPALPNWLRLEMENFLRNHNRGIDQFESAIWKTFRGKQVNPYIYTVRHEIEAPPGKEYINRNRVGFIAEIGTQRGFYQNTMTLVDNLRTNRTFCRNTGSVPINENFYPSFMIDWCRTRIHNLSMIEERKKSSAERIEEIEQKIMMKKKASSASAALTTKQRIAPPSPNAGLRDRGFSFWESFLVFPLIAVFCILLILLLSVIFFGRREGQQWRDYKTPKDQLEEYVSVRESQRHLRELSQQRQMLLMGHDRDRSTAPSGIHTFLQPRNRAPSHSSGARFSKSSSRINELPDERVELLAPVGKQTVAEAAKQCGSSLHLYRNPLESESDEDNEQFRQTD
ncbi:hypothetical protein WR25_03710 [Diploscapter pachys]|uniref:Dystroglycan-type cadherin-like domain-containing protein n=1 Tax=Diploscapter pachys TaxID=2018661 RepID=A0A2A2LNW2_9BILA|nr:hypothetical protein WR25_03710 [Diploscapter pachys]